MFSRGLAKYARGRSFGALTPIISGPSAFRNLPLDQVLEDQSTTLAFQEKWDKHFAEYNVWADDELRMLHDNLIQALVSKGRVDGWDKADDDGFLTRSFHFNSSHTAIHFMNEVSKVCSREDHHPEWNLKGHTLNVFLTSHFNDSKVSLKDYQLAAAMNDQYNETGPLAGYHPNDRAYAVEIGVGIFFLGVGYYYLKNL